MKIKHTLFIALFATSFLAQAQESPSDTEELKEVIISTNRIDLPFTENSRTITVISSEEIKNSAATNVADVLQQFAGVDIRRRGTSGGQADLYIRGGGFDQTLLLIDGIKTDNAQTGHNTMNAALPIEVIERIEIIKGPAARVFGHNAFTGAINIVTKKVSQNALSLKAEAGSFGQLNLGATTNLNFENSSHIINVGRSISSGYRYNSDYDNSDYFMKNVFNKNKQAIEMITSFSERNLGANGFYANESAIDQYQSSQNSLFALLTEFKTEKQVIKPRIYWLRSQNEYLFVRDEPLTYRNLHFTHKVGAEVNTTYTSKLGTTGVGLDVSETFINSNNLGNRDRFTANVFLEHRFKLLNNKLDITPGAALTYFSDFDFYAFPGLDVGYKFNNQFKVYGNIGYTYRIPTYTDLYYTDSSTLGNPDLEVEEAFAKEIGVKYSISGFSIATSFYERDTNNLIDYIRPDVTTEVYTATNIAEVNTKGFEVDMSYQFKINSYNQTVSTSYNYLKDDILNQNKDLSRYSLNTLKHHFTTRLNTKLFKNISQNIIYKYAERTTGDTYNVWDASIIMSLEKVEFSATANNIFNVDYIEAGYVPMPPSNVLFGIKYNI
ncbi:TonB-dependent receptor [unidentified eubacterium SCB49]|nr:TonB-dependent receptor [unidentified eubacterium SCB49]